MSTATAGEVQARQLQRRGGHLGHGLVAADHELDAGSGGR